MQYLLNLQEVLGFRCISLDIDNGGDEGVPFNSIVEKMDRCATDEGTMRTDPDCNCDMAVGGWLQSDARLGKVEFLPPFLIDGIGIATHIDETSVASAGAFFLTAFSLEVWGLVMMLAVVFTFLKILDRRFVPPDDSYTPLPASESRLRRMRHYFLNSRFPYRLRKAVQSTRTYYKWCTERFVCSCTNPLVRFCTLNVMMVANNSQSNGWVWHFRPCHGKGIVAAMGFEFADSLLQPFHNFGI